MPAKAKPKAKPNPKAAVEPKAADAKQQPALVPRVAPAAAGAGAGAGAGAAASAGAGTSAGAGAGTGAGAAATTPNPLNPWRKPVLTAAEMKFFADNGYVVVRNAVSREAATKVVDEMWEFCAPLKGDAKNVSQCYEKASQTVLNPLGFVEMYHSQGMWNNRQNPKVYNAFCDLYQNDRLWVTLDRVGLKLPPHKAHPTYKHPGFTHWDIDPTDADVLGKCADPNVPPFQLQGVIALTDTTQDMGGLHLYPGMHKYLAKWFTERKVAIDPDRVQSFYTRGFPVKVPQPARTLKGLKHVVVDMNAGDLAIWRGELAHGNGENVNANGAIRYAQYVTYYPEYFHNEAVRSWRLNSFKNRCHSGQVALPQLSQDGAVSKALNAAARGDTREWEKKNRKPPLLSALGERLLGAESWDAPVALADAAADAGAAGAAGVAASGGAAK